MINKADVIKGLQDIYDEAYSGWVQCQYTQDKMIKQIDETIPSALALIRAQDSHQAYWDVSDPIWQQCTLCGVAVKKSVVDSVKAGEDSNLNYCPHCGAQMSKAVKLHG